MAKKPILGISTLGAPPWPTIDPFLFCVHHNDAYPRGNAHLGPDASLAGRNLGQDFGGKDGWSMYHGQEVPGFPSHPHRGFETVTIVRQGLIDHSDSLGATARFGGTDTGGDTQWLTAGKGIVHSEMFPLLNQNKPNPGELFQIWLNLPAKSKMVAPHFTMLWAEKIPRVRLADAAGMTTEVVCIAGSIGDVTALAPPPDSWAAQPGSDVAIWTIKMPLAGRWTLPAALGRGTRRQLYFFQGASVTIGGNAITEHAAIELNAALDIELVNGPQVSEFLLLQGQPIAEPVAQYGPFVMNTQAEIHQAFADYRATEFGGWPFASSAPVHGSQAMRFAKHADGKVESFNTSPPTP